MGLVHHFLIYVANQFSGGYGYNERYAVLGDDDVISLRRIAKMYLEVCEKLGIIVSIAKSFESDVKEVATLPEKDQSGKALTPRAFLNFANQSYLGLINLSPASLKEEMKVVDSSSRMSFATRLLRRGWAQWGLTRGDLFSVGRLYMPPSQIRSTAASIATNVISPELFRAVMLALMPFQRTVVGGMNVSISTWARVLVSDLSALGDSDVA
jgi:hypothetical protein